MAEPTDELAATDLASVDARLVHHRIALGVRPDGTNVLVPPYGGIIAVAGPSGSGKSTFANGCYFRGTHGRLNLSAQNLAIFCPIGEGLYDERRLVRDAIAARYTLPE